MRRNWLRHIRVASRISREHEHDMRAFKRQNREALRQSAGNGRKGALRLGPLQCRLRRLGAMESQGRLLPLPGKGQHGSQTGSLPTLGSGRPASGSLRTGVHSDEMALSACAPVLLCPQLLLGSLGDWVILLTCELYSAFKLPCF